MILLVVLLHALFAIIFPFGKEAVKASDPIFFTGVRMTIAGFLLLSYHYAKNRTIFPLWKQYIWQLSALSIFNIFLTNVPEFWALKYLLSSKAAFLYSLCPFLAAIFSYFIFSEKLTVKKIIGMIIGSVGFIIMLLHESPSEKLIGGLGFISWAELAIIVAALSTVYGWISLRQLIRQKAATAIEANGISMLVGGLLALGTSLFFESWNPLPIFIYKEFFIYLILIITISNFICYNLYGYLLRRYTSTFISFVGFTEPLFAATYGWIFLSEKVGWYFFLSCTLLLVGLYIFYKEEFKQGYHQKIEN